MSKQKQQREKLKRQVAEIEDRLDRLRPLQ